MPASGFYKLLDNGELAYGRNRVVGPTYSLRRTRPEDRLATVDGWKWFESYADARRFHGLPTRAQIIRQAAETLGTAVAAERGQDLAEAYNAPEGE